MIFRKAAIASAHLKWQALNESQRMIITDCFGALTDRLNYLQKNYIIHNNPIHNQPTIDSKSLLISNRNFIEGIQTSLNNGFYFSNIFDFTKHISQKYHLYLFYWGIHNNTSLTSGQKAELFQIYNDYITKLVQIALDHRSLIYSNIHK
jgi:hypothetical protein